MEFTDLTPDKFDEIKGKQLTIIFKDGDKVVRTEQGIVSLVERTAFIHGSHSCPSLLDAIVFHDGTRVSIGDVIEFVDCAPEKKVYVKYE